MGSSEYFLDWEGYPPSERCWVDSTDINAPDKLKEFHTRYPGKASPPSLQASGQVLRRGTSVLDRKSLTCLTTAITDLREEVKTLGGQTSALSLRSREPIVSHKPRHAGSVLLVKRPVQHVGSAGQPPLKTSPSAVPSQCVLEGAAVGEEGDRHQPQRVRGGPLRAILYVRGLGRHKMREMKDSFTILGIPTEAVQFVSFIGANVAELIILAQFKDVIVEKLVEAKVQLDPNFDPTSPASFTDPETIELLGLESKTEEERSVIAREAFISRLDAFPKVLCVTDLDSSHL